MKYDEARHLIKSGDVLAWQGRNFWSRFIRHWTGKSYSHVAIVWVVGDRVFILEAKYGKGVRMVPLSNTLPCYLIHRKEPLLEEQLARALEEVGVVDYSVMDSIYAGLGIIPAAKGRQCAEYVNYVLGLPAHPIPGDVVDYLLSKGAKLEYLE